MEYNESMVFGLVCEEVMLDDFVSLYGFKFDEDEGYLFFNFELDFKKFIYFIVGIKFFSNVVFRKVLK